MLTTQLKDKLFVPGGRYRTLGLSIAAALLLLDQVTKWGVLALLREANPPVIEVTSFFNLVMVWNHGISFGMFAGHRQPLMLSIVSACIMMILLIWLYNNHCRWTAAGLGLVLGGAAGNVIDRVRYGAVADFLDFHVMHYHWPAFNIADSSIFIGVVLLCASSMLPAKDSAIKG